MKAIVIKNGYGLENIALVNVPKPVYEKNKVLVKTGAISLNQLDLMVAKGAFEKPLPHILGSDAVGVVEQIGSDVATLKKGDVVSTHFIQGWQDGQIKPSDLDTRLGVGEQGAFSEYISLPETSLVKIPSNLTAEEAATLPMAALTAWEAVVNAGKLKAGQTILLQGTGGVSIFALQFAKAIGARVIILSSADEKLEKAKLLGADEVINYTSNPNWEKRVQEITGGQGVDLALEMSWKEIWKTIEAMKMGGSISIVGLLGGEYTNLSVFGIMLKSLTIKGIQVGSRTSFEETNRFIQANNIKPVIDKVFPISELSEAVAYFDNGKHFGKVALTF